MTVYKYFLKAAIRQKWIILGYAGMFFFLSIINSTNTGRMEEAFIDSSLNIGIVDNSHSDLSRGLLDHLEKNNNLIQMEDDRNYLEEQILLEAVHGVILIPEDFEDKVKNKMESIEIFRDDRKMESIQIGNEINKFLIFSNASYKNGDYNLDKLKEALSEEVEVEMLSIGNNSKGNAINNWFKNYFNFTGYIIIAVYVAVMGLVMAEFNDKNIQDRVKISSKKFLNLNMEVYLGQVTLGILITGIFIFGVMISKGKYIDEINFIKYIINISAFSFSILCFTSLINNLTRSSFVINGISTVASLGTGFISGVFVPQEFLGEKVLNIAKFFPTYYFVKVNEMGVNSFIDIRYDIFMQILFGFVFLILGLYFSKIRQKL